MPPMTIDRLLSISIGHRDDNLIQKIEIDISSWQSKYPNLDTYRIEMVDAENRKQIALNTSVKDGYLIWIITNKNTAVEGEGSYQVIATGANGQQKASRSAALFVRNRIHGDGQEDAPEYMKPLLDQVAENASRAEEAAKRAESAAVGKVPFATSDTAGIVKVGEGLIIEEDGTLSVMGGSGPSDPSNPGAPGAPGEDGEDGGYYIPSVNEDGELTWTASKENMPKIPSTNIKGEPGEPGVPGKDGIDGKDGEDGEPGKSGVFVGSEEPTDPNISVWIDPNGETNLPTASATVRGGVKVGEGLQMDGDVLGVKPEQPMRLIGEIITEEEVAIIKLTADASGKPISVKKAFVTLTPGAGIVSNFTGLLTDGTSALLYISSNEIKKTNASLVSCLSIENGRLFVDRTMTYTTDGQTCYEGVIPYGRATGMVKQDAITSVGANALAGNVWPVGTKLAIYEMGVF